VTRAKVKVAAVVLAAGQSRRSGPVNKLLARAGAVSMIECTVDAVLQTGLHETVVVTGYQAEAVRAALGTRAVRFVHNPAFANGLSSSLQAGIGSLGESVDAALVCLADMPMVSSTLMRSILAAYRPGRGCAIVVPCHAGKRGNPVLWDRRFFTEMASIEGDVGAKHLLVEHSELVCELPVEDDAVLTDFDALEALQALARRRTGAGSAE